MPCWTWLMEFPDDCGLLLRALPDAGCAWAFGLGAPFSPGSGKPLSPAPRSMDELVDYPDAWKLVPDGWNACSPARELAWDVPGRNLAERPAVFRRAGIAGRGAQPGRWSWILAGNISATSSSSLQPSVARTPSTWATTNASTRAGAIAYFKTNPFVNSADRFVCDAGPAAVRRLSRTRRAVSSTHLPRPAGARAHPAGGNLPDDGGSAGHGWLPLRR